MTSSLQESHTSDAEGKAVNQRPKIFESGLAVKWSALLHPLNTYFQALIVMRFDGTGLGTEASDCTRNLRVI